MQCQRTHTRMIYRKATTLEHERRPLNYQQSQKLLPLHSVWLDLFILRMMGDCPDAQVWIVLDELASLNKLPQLHTAVSENRKCGEPVGTGLSGP